MFDSVVYINLDHRTDRKENVEKELTRMGITNFERFSAVKREPGYVGALESHLNVLKQAKEKGKKNILIVEDDFEFTISKEKFWELIDAIKNVDYDVIMLGANRGASRTKNANSTNFNKTLYKVEFAMAPSAYLVHSQFYDTLIKKFEECLPKLIETNEQGAYALDVCWADLQPKSKWYLFKEKKGKQKASYSNIQKTQVNYQTGGKKKRKTRRSKKRK